MVDRRTRSADRHRFPANVTGFMFAPVLWFGYFLALYAVQGTGCEIGLADARWLGVGALRLVLGAMTAVVAIAIAVIGVRSFASWRALRAAGSDPAGASGADQSLFLAYGALLHAALFLVAVLWIGVPVLMADPCNPAG